MFSSAAVAVLADLRGLEDDDDAGRCSLRGGLVDDDEEDDEIISDDKISSASAALKSFSGMLVETTDAEESRRVRTRAAAEEHAAVATGRFMFIYNICVCRSRLECNLTMQTVARVDHSSFPLLTAIKSISK